MSLPDTTLVLLEGYDPDLVDLEAADPFALARRQYLVSDSGYTTEPAAELDKEPFGNRYFEHRLGSVTYPFQSLFSRGQIAGPSAYDPLRIKVDVLDRKINDQELLDFRRMVFRRQVFRVFEGHRGGPFSSFVETASGLIEELEVSTTEIDITGWDPALLLSEPLQRRGEFYFNGLGSALDFDGTSSVFLSVPHSPFLDPTELDVDCVCNVRSLPAGHMQLFGKGQSSAGRWLCQIRSSGAIRMTVNSTAYETTAGLIKPGTTYRVRVRADASGHAIYLDGEQVFSNTVPYAAPSSTDPLYIGAAGPGGSRVVDGWVTEFSLASSPRDDIEVVNAQLRPFHGSEGDLEILLHMDEALGSVVFDSSPGGHVGTITGLGAGVEWVDTGGGDKDLASKAMPVGLGLALWAEPVVQNARLQVYRWHCRRSNDLLWVRKGGVTLVRDLSLSDSFTFSAVGSQITAATAGTLRHVVVGQVITVTGSAKNDKDLTVTAVGPSNITVAEALSDETVSCTVSTKAGAADYDQVDLLTSSFRLLASPDGDIRVGFEGDAEGGYAKTPAAIAERLFTDFYGLTVAAGQVTAMDVEISAESGFYASEEVDGITALDHVTGAHFAYISEPSTGEFSFFRIPDPATTVPVGTIRGCDQIVADTLKELPGGDPAWWVQVLHAKTWGVVDKAQLFLSVLEDPDLLHRATEEYRIGEDRDLTVRDTYQLQDQALEIKTGLASIVAARSEAVRLLSLLKVPRLPWEFVTDLPLQLGESWFIEDEDVDGTKPYVVIGMGPEPNGLRRVILWG
ncbi:MAG: LamG domain-containing protein [Deltaproteobacteria bacterium]|nr:LamG domain-containing protein [Deltaproteobacteria bacterium]